MAIREARTGAVVITGASTGIGRACALYLDRLGFRVFAGVRREVDGEALRETASTRLVPLMIDVTRSESVAAAAETVASAEPQGLHGLVNNAGIVVPGPLEILPLDAIRRQLDINLFGTVAVTQAFLPQLRKARGRIVNMGSINGLLSTPLSGPYSISKFAIEAFTDALRMELKPWGIEVVVVEPGSIKTPIWEKTMASGESMYGELSEDGKALYDPMIQGLRDSAQKISGMGIPPERVAAAVAHALTADRPRTRYIVGRDARFLRLLQRWLPDRLRDRIILRGMGMMPRR